MKAGNPPRPYANSREELQAIATALQLSSEFPPEVMAEADAWVADPQVADPALVDRTNVPFVTIDSEKSKDLDQAIYVEKTATGHRVEYAIADAAFYIRPGSALFAEALRRGASYYFPGFSVPMLPRSLSEGVISLNPNVERRALVFRHELDAHGEVTSTTLQRARIRSRGKLSFAGVQGLFNTPASSPLSGAEFEPSLRSLAEVGRQRMALAAARGLVRYRREEVQVDVDGQGVSFAVMEVVRDEIELWNEQISLLCNAEGGRLLREHPSPAVQPIYRVQGGPEPERLDALARLTQRVAELHGLPPAWAWNQQTTTLADYVASLPRAKFGSREDRVSRALTRQAMMVNLHSEYSTEPGAHTGVGAEPYARFSAPMREMVGVFLHKEAVEMLTGVAPPEAEDEALRAEVVKVANRARATQKKVQNLANEAVLNRLFAPQLALAENQRRQFLGTVMGFAGTKVHVRLDVPPLDVKLQFFDLAPFFNNAWLAIADDGATLRAQRSTGAPVFTLGQTVAMIVHHRDEKTRRWAFKPLAMPASPR